MTAARLAHGNFVFAIRYDGENFIREIDIKGHSNNKARACSRAFAGLQPKGA